MPRTKTISQRNINNLCVPVSIELKRKVDEMIKERRLTLADFLRHTLEDEWQRSHGS